MANTLLMPKATAVWLVDNTALTFEQIAQFCTLHPLEVKAIADGELAQGIKGMDPVITGQLTREEIARGEADPNHRLKLSDPKVRVPDRSARDRAIRRCRSGRTGRTPSSGWCATIPSSRTRRFRVSSARPSRRSSRSANASTGIRPICVPMDPVTLGPVLADRPRPRGAARLARPAAGPADRRYAAAGLDDRKVAGRYPAAARRGQGTRSERGVCQAVVAESQGAAAGRGLGGTRAIPGDVENREEEPLW